VRRVTIDALFRRSGHGAHSDSGKPTEMMMSARWILAILAVVFAALAVFALVRSEGRWVPAAKTWTIIAVVFAVVSFFLLR